LEKSAIGAILERVRAISIPSRLRAFVRAMRVVSSGSSAAPHGYRRLPDGESELLVHFTGERTTATLIGTRTTRLLKPVSASGGALLVRFRAGGAFPFFAQPISELTDRMVPLDVLWEREARAAIEDAAGGPAAIAATIGALQRRAQGDELSANGVRVALQKILESPELPRVSSLAAELGVSERQLLRVFNERVGVSPKTFLRIVRFRRALRAARASARPDWAAIAATAGYFDQAHLIADFRALGGQTPTALLASVAPPRARE
jgi:AraC-like DNA-binding protein